MLFWCSSAAPELFPFIQVNGSPKAADTETLIKGFAHHRTAAPGISEMRFQGVPPPILNEATATTCDYRPLIF